MTGLVGALVIVRSNVFHDRFQLVWVTKETKSTLTVKPWHKRRGDWDPEARRNDKTIINLVEADASIVPAAKLHFLATQMESYEANAQDRIGRAKAALADDMRKATLR